MGIIMNPSITTFAVLSIVIFKSQIIYSQQIQNIVDTGQDRCYDNTREIKYPKPSQAFFGQDAEFQGKEPAYKDNKDGTISDLNTGLMWSKGVDDTKVSLIEAEKLAKQLTLGGHKDWRVPNIKELYSLIDFRGCTGFSRDGQDSGPPIHFNRLDKNKDGYISEDETPKGPPAGKTSR